VVELTHQAEVQLYERLRARVRVQGNELAGTSAVRRLQRDTNVALVFLLGAAHHFDQRRVGQRSLQV
jgi:hypothetical protein